MFDTIEELIRQISLGEDSSLELKDLRFKGAQVNEPHRNTMPDEMVAMANTSTGVFILGVDEETRSIVGIPEEKLDAVETWIRGIANDLITPRIDMPDTKIPCTVRRWD
jgi:ATP-dependent DNA helicase RecG